MKPRDIFEKLFLYIEQHNIVLPAYSVMQDLVGKVIKEEQIRLQNIRIKNMPTAIHNALAELLSTQDNYYEMRFTEEPHIGIFYCIRGQQYYDLIMIVI